MLAAKLAAKDVEILFAFYEAVRDSTYGPIMEEILEDDHLESYQKLKKVFVETIKLDMSERYQQIFAAPNADPLGTYNRLRELNANAKDIAIENTPKSKTHSSQI